MDNTTVTLPLREYDAMRDEIITMKKALNDKSFVIASYYGYKYHIVNADEKMKDLMIQIESLGGFKKK